MWNKRIVISDKQAAIAFSILALGGLYLASRYSFLLFHNVAEIFIIVVAWSTFMFAWNARAFIENNYILLIGIAFLFIGTIELLHTLAYKGMNIFSGYDANLPTQLWIAARYMESLSFLIAPFLLQRKITVNSILLAYLAATLLLVLAIFYWDIFPDCYIEGRGLTRFKIASEYVICIIFLISLIILIKKRNEFEPIIVKLLAYSIVINIVSELAFTLYLDVYGLRNLIGHFFQIIAVYLIYLAIIRTGLMEPYSLLSKKLRIERDRARQYFDIAGAMLVVLDRNGNVAEINRSGCKILGYPEAEILGKNWFDNFLPASIRETTRQVFQQMIAGELELVGSFESPVSRSDGGQRTIEWCNAIIKDAGGQIRCTLSSGVDITERKRAEEALFEEKERAQVTLHSIGDAVITTDAQGRGEYLNPIAETLTGWTTAEARGRPLDTVFRIIDEQSRQPAPDPVSRCLQERRIVGLADYSVLVGRGGREYAIEDSAAPIRSRDGTVLGAVLVFRDVTETRRLVKQMAHEATHDALTGLINRREFEQRLERALASANQYGAHHALCYLDLDQFKIVNDTAGHGAGDELLKQIKNLLLGTFRERDTLARLGGDEFGLLLNNCPLEKALLIARNVVAGVRAYRFVWAEHTFQIGVSIGLVAVTAQSESTAQLLSQADIACYTAKEQGRNRVHVYQRQDSETGRRHSEILRAAGLRNALEQERFRLYAQPIVALAAASDAPVGYDLRPRLLDDSGELLLPEAFIPAAERYGLMGALDRWVIQTAFRGCAEQTGAGEAGIAINLSGNSLNDDTLLDFVQARLREFALAPEQVWFEISEAATVQNPPKAIDFMAALRTGGSRLVLDDFGAGLSSFRYLKTLPVDYLKIDASLVQDILDSAGGCAIVAAINRLGHGLGLRTIAAGARDPALVQRLRELGVDYAQGDALGPPLPWIPRRSRSGLVLDSINAE